MGSVRNFKKKLNQELSELIEECYAIQLEADDKVGAKAEKVIDEVIALFDEVVLKVNQEHEDAKLHYKNIKGDLSKSIDKLNEKIEKLKA